MSAYTPSDKPGKVTRGVKPPHLKGGSRKGIPNKATTDVRKAIALLAERNVGKLEAWISAVAKGSKKRAPDPGRAADLFLRAVEYHIPKLRSIEGSITVNTPEQEIADDELRDLIDDLRMRRAQAQKAQATEKAKA